MKEWIGLIGTISGVVIGGLITVGVGFLQRRHDIEKEKRSLLLSKYEELHSLLGELVDGVNILTNQIVSEAALDSKFDPKVMKSRIPTERITMLIEFYVPELKDNHEYIKKQVNFLYEHVTKHLIEVNKTKQFKLESAAMAVELSKATVATVSNMKNTLANSASLVVKKA